MVDDTDRRPPERGVEVIIDPPLPGDPELDRAFLVPRHDPVLELAEGQTMSVYVVPVDEPFQIAFWADIGLREEDLPKTQEQYFDETSDTLLQTIEELGVDVLQDPPSLPEGLANWVENMQSERRSGTLRADWAKRLETIPGWLWQDVSEVELVEQFAKREGHTDIPFDHVEDAFWLGRWVQGTRHLQDVAQVFDTDNERRIALERIPGWHW